MAREVPNPKNASEGQTLRVQNGEWVRSTEPTVYVQSTEPSNASDGDVWIDTS